jgi:ryanodine receptor 2
MNKHNYIPQPIDTSDIRLSEDLLRLTEQIAANVHDIWSAGRIAEGWQYGETRDDVRKLHPCLVPYDELPENEKEYDRNTAMETLKTIILLEFNIVTTNS